MSDVKFTNATARRALEFQQHGIWLRKLDLESLEILVFHDAAWANALPRDTGEHDPDFVLSLEDHEKERKPKITNSRVASQYHRRWGPSQPHRLEVFGNPESVQIAVHS